MTIKKITRPSNISDKMRIRIIALSLLQKYWSHLSCYHDHQCPRLHEENKNVIHISSPAMPTCVLDRNLRIFVTWHYPCSYNLKIIVFDIIWYAVYYSAAKFKLPTLQPSNMATKCGIRWSWKLKVKPIIGCRNTIVILFNTLNFLFHLDNPKIDGVVVV